MYKYQSITKLIARANKAIIAAGISGVNPAVISYWAYWIKIAFSLTIAAQSAAGGWIPKPKKLKLETVKIIKSYPLNQNLKSIQLRTLQMYLMQL